MDRRLSVQVFVWPTQLLSNTVKRLHVDYTFIKYISSGFLSRGRLHIYNQILREVGGYTFFTVS